MKSLDSKDLSLKSFFKNFASEVFHIDGRIGMTLIALLAKPGYLTLAYFNSWEEKYVQPLKLYFVINFIFFLIVPILTTPQFQIFHFSLKSLTGSNQKYQSIIKEQIQASDVSKEIYEERFDSHLKYSQPAFVFITIPFFALLLGLLNIRNRRFYLEHLLFSLHFFSYLLLSLLVTLSLYRILILGCRFLSVPDESVAVILLFGMFLWISAYLFISSGRFYKDEIASRIIKFPILMTGIFATLGLYSQFLFFYTIMALKWGY
ncbi:MAG: DUF3667 domain-containing protein [Planctomycetota bacterium]